MWLASALCHYIPCRVAGNSPANACVVRATADSSHAGDRDLTPQGVPRGGRPHRAPARRRRPHGRNLRPVVRATLPLSALTTWRLGGGVLGKGARLVRASVSCIGAAPPQTLQVVHGHRAHGHCVILGSHCLAFSGWHFYVRCVTPFKHGEAVSWRRRRRDGADRRSRGGRAPGEG